MAPDPMLIDVSNEDCFSHECFGTTLEPDMEIIDTTDKEVEERKEFDSFKSPTKLIKEWVPTCEEALVPKEGLIFDDLEQCEKFYKTYAHEVRFSVHKSAGKKDKEGIQKFKWTKMASSKPIFDVDDNVLDGCLQMKVEEKLIFDNWMEFMTCLEVVGKDPEMLSLALKGISNVTNN
ncbi:hypothetical protein Cgig2_027718 [Carnegiea gigantea]|uniref:Protein FAR1-RELATED SEQUENCE n=1 Tax=Carnegiea gigantea TaxID=171969 RepID=A0A9Q1JQ60_9CARY|nr:hypothetical protein Cgig2_027718 [Carnegiea gigantea]